MQRLQTFCSEDLGGFYLDVLKDRLYTAATTSRARRIRANGARADPRRAAEADGAGALVHGGGSAGASSIRRTRRSSRTSGPDAAGAARRRRARREMVAHPGRARRRCRRRSRRCGETGEVGSSLQAEVAITAPPDDYAALASLGDDLRFVMITSAATVAAGRRSRSPSTASRHRKCDRCWHYRADVGAIPRIRRSAGAASRTSSATAKRAVSHDEGALTRCGRLALAGAERPSSSSPTRRRRRSSRRGCCPNEARPSAACSASSSRSTTAPRSASGAGAGGWQRWLFMAIAVAAIILIAWLLKRGGDAIYCAGLALILGGAIGNLCDRIVLGKVVDFLLFHYDRWAFPAFNVADSAITVGAALVILDSLLATPHRFRAVERRQGGMMDVLLANPRGFCAGVDRAIAIVLQALAKFGAPIYVRHEVVHNKFVVDDLRAKGAIFVEELAEVPAGSTVVFSAHGVSKAVRAEADARGLRVFDATCPLVTKVHVEIAKMHERGLEIVMIGHKGHPEVEGTMGQCEGGVYLVETVDDVGRLAVRDPVNLAYVTQTTLSVDDAAGIVAALRERFPTIVGPKKDDICYATQNRQDAVKFIAPRVDVMIVVGSPNSSNSNRLREVAAHRGIPGVHGRPRRRAPPRMDRGQAARRHHRRRVGAGGARPRSRRAPRVAGRRPRARDRRCRRKRSCFRSPRGSAAHPDKTRAGVVAKLIRVARVPCVTRRRARSGTTPARPRTRRLPVRLPSRRRSACRPPSLSARTSASPK